MPITWYPTPSALLEAIKEKVDRAATVLDIGCGIRPQDFTVPDVHICCEPFSQYVDYLTNAILQKRSRLFYDRKYVVLNVSWDEVIKIFSAHSVDTIFLLDVIEHLPKDNGEQLLRATEQLCDQQIVLFTPLGFLPQDHPDGKDAWGFEGGNMQEHKSGWLPEDFDESWDVLGCKSFHYFDNAGRFYDKPYGAFFAIKSIEKSSKRSLSALETLDLFFFGIRYRFAPVHSLWKRLIRRIKMLLPIYFLII